tara:strand:- start:153 stop:350 length:198 start_codon:yes stop_codon:yes gene_type:complete
MFVKLKKGHYWVFSSEKASLDCMPQQKFSTIEKLNKWLKPEISKFEKAKKMQGQRIREWAVGLNR